MSFRSGILRSSVVAAAVLILAFSSFADTIKLKDGSIIKGKITTFGKGKFTVVMGDGSRRREMTFAANEIESISFDSPDNAPQLRQATNQNTTYKEPTKVQSEPVRQPETKQYEKPRNSSNKMPPIEWRIKVLADNTANGWTNTGWVVKKGQRIRITGDGKVSIGQGRSTTPSGSPGIADEQKLLKNVATGALIAVIGDDNNDFIYVGSSREITATRDGALFLGINEGYLEDNNGSFEVKIEILPNDAE